MFSGLLVTSVSSIDEAERVLQDPTSIPTLDFVILDSQSEHRADELARFLHGLVGHPFKDTKLIHLYTPTTDSLTGHTTLSSDTPGVIRMTKPPRRARLLHMLTIIKYPEMHLVAAPVAPSKDETLLHRSLYGNVLIAEGLFESEDA